jgi:hypothetical protein
MYDDNSIASRVNVELDGIRTPLDSPAEGRQGILGMLAFRAPMGDAFQGLCSLYGDVYCRRFIKRLTLTGRTW